MGLAPNVNGAAADMVFSVVQGAEPEKVMVAVAVKGLYAPHKAEPANVNGVVANMLAVTTSRYGKDDMPMDEMDESIMVASLT
jgi:hypothetical protein